MPRAPSITSAVWSSALDGIQPTFRANTAEGFVTLHEDRIEPEVCASKCGGVSARSRAEYKYLGADVQRLQPLTDVDGSLCGSLHGWRTFRPQALARFRRLWRGFQQAH